MPSYWPSDEEEKRYSAVAAVIVNAADQGKSIKRVLRLMAASAPPQGLVRFGFGFAAWEVSAAGKLGNEWIAIYQYPDPLSAFKSEMQFDAEVEPCIEMVRQTIDLYENSLNPRFGFVRLLDLQGMLGKTVEQISQSVRRMSLQLIPSLDVSRLEAASNRSTIDWLARSIELYQAGKKEESLDVIFDTIDDMLLASRFDDCDAILTETSVAELSNPQLLTLLTATAAAKDRLPGRQALIGRVKLVLEERGGDASRLLAGLE